MPVYVATTSKEFGYKVSLVSYSDALANIKMSQQADMII
jgi:hypothetical protein